MTNAELTPGPQVVGEDAKRPERGMMKGMYVTVEPLDPAKHRDALWHGCGGLANQELWRYMHGGPFAERAAFDAYLESRATGEDPMYFVFVDRATGHATGHAAYMRIDPSQRVIEVGSIVYAPAFQKTRAATEAMYPERGSAAGVRLRRRIPAAHDREGTQS